MNAAQNIEKCVRRCGLEVDDIILKHQVGGRARTFDQLGQQEQCTQCQGWPIGQCLIGPVFEVRRAGLHVKGHNLNTG